MGALMSECFGFWSMWISGFQIRNVQPVTIDGGTEKIRSWRV
jgi:hypothetical protein